MKLPGEAETLQGSRAVKKVVEGPKDVWAPAAYRAGKDITWAANNMQAAFEREQARIDKDRVEDSHTQLVNFKIEMASGENGYKTKLGGDAVKTPLLKDSLRTLDEYIKAESKKLDNERQRDMFKAHSDVIRGQITQGVLTHQFNQDKVYQKELLAGTQSAETNSAAMNWNVPGEVDGSLLRIKKRVGDYATANGMPKEAKQAMELEATTDIHAAVITRAINAGQSGYARKWLKDHRDEIDSTTAARLEGTLKTAGNREASQWHADRIWGEGGSASEMTAKARKILDPAKRAGALSLLKARISEEEVFAKKDQADALDESIGIMADAISNGHIPTQNDIPIDMFDRMNGAGQARVLGILSDAAEGVAPVKASPTYYKLEQMHAADEKVFAALNLNDYTGLITPEEKTRFIGYQKDTVTGGPVGDIATTKAMIIKQGIAAAGLDVKKMIDGDEELAYQRRVDAETKALGRDVTAADIREITDRLSIETVKQRPWYWNDIEAPAALADIEDVPDEFVDELAEIVQDLGLDVTHNNIKMAKAIQDAGQSVTLETMRLFAEHLNK